MQELLGLLRRCPTMDVLAHFSFHEELADPATFSEDTHEGKQAFVEYLTLLALTQPCSAGEPPFPALALEDVHDRVSEVFRLANELAPPHLGGPADERARLGWLAYVLHLHAKLLRNPGFKQHRDQVLDALLSPLEGWSSDTFGFSCKQARQLNRGVETLLNGRLVARRTEVQAAMTMYKTAVTRFRATGQVEHGLDAALVRKLAGAKRGKRKRVLADLGVAAMFADFGTLMQFTATDLAEHVGLPVTTTEAYLLARSLGFGDVPASFEVPDARDTLLLRPFVRNGERFLAPALSLLDWGLRPFYEEKMIVAGVGGGDVPQRYRDDRAAVLEKVACDALRRALPGARVEGNLKYRVRAGGETVEGELDGLAVFANIAIVLEAKSGAFSWKAKDGSLPHLEDALAKTLTKAQAQMVAFKQLLESGLTVPFTREGRAVFELDGREVSRTFMVAVTLEDMSTYTTWLRHLVDRSVLAPDGLPWAVLVFDLCAIADLCETPSQLLCFLDRRAKLTEDGRITAGSELDFWGWFLSHGLRFNLEGPERPDSVQLASGTREIEQFFYYQEGWRKTPTRRPRWNLPETLKLIIMALDREPEPQRVVMAVGLQDLARDQQEDLAKEVETYLKLSRRDGRARGFSVRPENIPWQLWAFLTARKPSEQDVLDYMERMPADPRRSREFCICVACAPGPRIDHIVVYPPA